MNDATREVLNARVIDLKDALERRKHNESEELDRLNRTRKRIKEIQEAIDSIEADLNEG